MSFGSWGWRTGLILYERRVGVERGELVSLVARPRPRQPGLFYLTGFPASQAHISRFAGAYEQDVHDFMDGEGSYGFARMSREGGGWGGRWGYGFARMAREGREGGMGAG